MPDTVTHRAIIASARKEIRALKKPPDMRSDLWANQQAFLLVLAGYLPDVWPSMRTLADKLDCSPMAIHRRIKTAQRFGLIGVETRTGSPLRWDGQRYLLMCLSTGLKATIQKARPVTVPCNGSGTEVSPSPSEKDTSLVPSGLAHGSGSALADDTPVLQEAPVPMNRFDPGADDPDVPIGGSAAPLPVYGVRPVDHGARLAKLFDERWLTMARRNPEYRGVRPSDRGMAIGYIKGVMLTQVDVEAAEAYIESYAPAVAEGRAVPKLGQRPFEHFTGWWGSEDIEMPVDAAEKDHRAWVLAEGRRLIAEKLAALDEEIG